MKTLDIQDFKKFIESKIDWFPTKSGSISKENFLDSLCQFTQHPADFLNRNKAAFGNLLRKVFVNINKPARITHQNFLLHLYGFKRCYKCKTAQNHDEFFVDAQRWDNLTYYCKSYSKQYTKDNIENIRLIKKKYKNSILPNTPTWLTETQLSEIRYFYLEAQRLSRVSNEQHDVDHIIPLKGENVCGLHVPWNLQVLPHIENIKKGNKYEDS